jgi:hypothetical protein
VALDSDPEFFFDLYVNPDGLRWRSRFDAVDIQWSSVTRMNFKINEPRDRDSYRSLGWVMGPGSPIFFAVMRKLRLRRSSSTLAVRYGEPQQVATLRVGRRSDILWRQLKPAFKLAQRMANG